MQKFIITIDGELRFGDVRMHKELIPYGGSDCYGGGFWSLALNGRDIQLYGESRDFGPPSFDQLHSVDWSTLDGMTHRLLYYPFYPDTQEIQQINWKNLR